MLDDDMREARARTTALRESLPQTVDAAALGVWSKAPFQILCTREALIWRTEELARSACDALERRDLAVAALLVRAMIENAALTWRLMEVLDEWKALPPKERAELLASMMIGSRLWPDAPKALQILTCIDRMDKKVKGIRASYDILSEAAHPNWRGVFGMYAEVDEPTFTAHFGRGLRSSDATKGQIVDVLLGALGSFEVAYNRISDAMPSFLGELESIWPQEDPAAL
jgi:alkylhydroperoxidase/carboxymuconolactone decarboxylase family protein YurZ